MKKTFFTVVRHGQTEWNAFSRMQGQKDSPLTETGIRQAEATGQFLAGESIYPDFDCIFSSDLGRAADTAKAISTALEMDIIFDEQLREYNFGIFEGLTSEEINERYPEEIKAFRSCDPSYRVPGGECKADCYGRHTSFLKEKARELSGSHILIVSHGGFLDNLFRFIFDIPLGQKRSFSIVNSSVNRCACTDGSWELLSWGENGHLAGLPSLENYKAVL